MSLRYPRQECVQYAETSCYADEQLGLCLFTRMNDAFHLDVQYAAVYTVSQKTVPLCICS